MRDERPPPTRTSPSIVQGITGRQARTWHPRVPRLTASGSSPGHPGVRAREVHGVPVFDTCLEAVAHHGGPIDGAVATVPPAFTRDAVMEAIENGIKLIAAIVTERIPRRDVAEMVEFAVIAAPAIASAPTASGWIPPASRRWVASAVPPGTPRRPTSPAVWCDEPLRRDDDRDLLDADRGRLGVSTAISIGGAIIGPTYAERCRSSRRTRRPRIVIYTEPAAG